MACCKRDFKCKNNPDDFCFICGHYIFGNSARKITNSVRDAYFHYFGFRVKNLDKSWTPNFICASCRLTLMRWVSGKGHNMKFGVPMMWTEPFNHDQCYFCVIDLKGKTRKKRKLISYPNVASAKKPKLHDHTLPIPRPPISFEASSESDSEADNSESGQEGEIPHRVSQAELNDLVRDLKLSKFDSEVLGSRLQQWGSLGPSTSTSKFRNRHKTFSSFFTKSENICYCNDVQGLFEALKLENKVDDWRLFIDSSKHSLKAALLHKGNSLPSIPVAHSENTKETYLSISNLLELIQYKQFNWKICADLKVSSFGGTV